MTGGEQQLDEQRVQFFGSVEIIALARLGSRVCHVVGRKFLDGAEHGVGAWDADVKGAVCHAPRNESNLSNTKFIPPKAVDLSFL